MINDLKWDYLTNEIENNHDPAKFWKKKMHSMFPDEPSTGNINLIDQENNETIYESLIPNYANAFFTSIGPEP